MRECKRLKKFMKKNFISYRDLARALGMSPGGVHKMLERGTCTAEQHARFVDLGFPENMLPVVRAPRLPAFQGHGCSTE